MKTIINLALGLALLLLPSVSPAGGGGWPLLPYEHHKHQTPSKAEHLLWQNHFDREGDLFDAAWDVAVKGHKVFVVGETGTTAGGSAFTVKAYNAKNGKLLWENYYDREEDLQDVAYKVVTERDTVFVVGETGSATGGSAFTVRAYNARNGSLLWEDNYDREGDLFDAAWDVAVKGHKVFVVGETGTTAGGSAFTVKAYNAKNGKLLWENYYDREEDLQDVAYKVVAKGDTVFVVGETGSATGGSAFSVRAYNAKNGVLLWENHYDREGNLDDVAGGVAVSDKYVLVTGLTTTTAGYWAFSVRAFNAINGELLWEDHHDRNKEMNTKEVIPGDTDWTLLNWWDWANSVVVSGNKAFVAGTASTAEGARAFSVRAYNVADGTLLWEDHYDKEGYRSDEAVDIIVRGNKVFVAGMTDTTAGSDAMSVRVYNAIDGTLVWEDYYDREGNLGADDWAWRVVASDNKIFVAGGTATATGGTAFSVRAYYQ